MNTENVSQNDYPVPSKQNKKKSIQKKRKIDKQKWKSFVLNYKNWNRGYVQPILVWIFLYFFISWGVVYADFFFVCLIGCFSRKQSTEIIYKKLEHNNLMKI